MRTCVQSPPITTSCERWSSCRKVIYWRGTIVTKPSPSQVSQTSGQSGQKPPQGCGIIVRVSSSIGIYRPSFSLASSDTRSHSQKPRLRGSLPYLWRRGKRVLMSTWEKRCHNCNHKETEHGPGISRGYNNCKVCGCLEFQPCDCEDCQNAPGYPPETEEG